MTESGDIPGEAGARNAADARAPVVVGRDRALRAVTVLVVLATGAAGIALPGSVLLGGCAWLVFLVFVLAGWGALVATLVRFGDADFGLAAALGAAGYLAASGVLLAAGALSRPVVLALIGVGAAGFVWSELRRPTALWQRIRGSVGFVRADPPLGALAIVLGALAGVRLIAAVAELHGLPPDDDLAYTAMLKRLLDTGDLIEPFSFRRLGAYGGQTVLQALAAARGTLANIHLVDKGLALAVTLLALLGHARQQRTRPLWLALIALLVIILPESAINTASCWTGVLLFFALYRCTVRGHAAAIGLVAAATCTLRQNFLATVALFIASALMFRLIDHQSDRARRASLADRWRTVRRDTAVIAGVAAAALAPWCLAAYASSHTFLFPVVPGTWNRGLSLAPSVTSAWQELADLVVACLEPSPIFVLPILALVAPFATDRRTGRPLTALVVASALGFVFLSHGLVGSDPYNVWRYAFGFVTALVAALVLEFGSDEASQRGSSDPSETSRDKNGENVSASSGVVLASLGQWAVLTAIALQIVVDRAAIGKHAAAWFDDIRDAAVQRAGQRSAARAEHHRYEAMQAAIPAGSAMVVMLDDPWLLDYRRNPIANLDTPGFASPGSQLPAFAGAEAMRRYLVAEGYRYAAFVRTDRSRNFFRREFWLSRIFVDIEVFQIMAAYTIDAIENFAELATPARVRYDRDGLVVVDLADAARPDAAAPATGGELARRTAWVRALAEREHLHDAWTLATRADVRFEDGTGPLRFVDDSVDDPAWYEVSHAHAPAGRGRPILPLQQRAHLRVRGSGGDMRLVLRAAISRNMVFTHPRLDLSLDGALLASLVADDRGRYALEITVPRAQLGAGWHDLYLTFSTLLDPDRDLRDARAARLEIFEWSPP